MPTSTQLTELLTEPLPKVVNPGMHGKIDPGSSALVASMPNLLNFSDERESKLFQGMGIGLAAVRSLTKFEEGSSKF